jgi:hypothetical protein
MVTDFWRHSIGQAVQGNSLTLEDEADRLSRDAANHIPTQAAQLRSTAQLLKPEIFAACFSKL